MLALLFVSLVAAIVPTAFYVFVIWWIDRYEREPAALLTAAFLWGAVPAILLALVAELGLAVPLGIILRPEQADAVGTVLVAPVVEEVVKAAALLGLLLFFRLEIDDVLDGIVYGAMIGAGFAMTENFFYFVGAGIEHGWAAFSATVLLRAGVFGLSHALFTAISGVGIAVLARQIRQPGRWLLAFTLLLLAIAAHFWHNFGLSLSDVHGLTFLLVIASDWGGVLLLFVVVLLARRTERRWIREYLAPEVPETMSEALLARLQTPWQRLGRLSGLLRGEGWQRARLHVQLQQAAMNLAFYKARLARSGPEEGEALQREIAVLRATLRELHEQWQAEEP